METTVTLLLVLFLLSSRQDVTSSQEFLMRTYRGISIYLSTSLHYRSHIEDLCNALSTATSPIESVVARENIVAKRVISLLYMSGIDDDVWFPTITQEVYTNMTTIEYKYFWLKEEVDPKLWFPSRTSSQFKPLVDGYHSDVCTRLIMFYSNTRLNLHKLVRADCDLKTARVLCFGKHEDKDEIEEEFVDETKSQIHTRVDTLQTELQTTEEMTTSQELEQTRQIALLAATTIMEAQSAELSPLVQSVSSCLDASFTKTPSQTQQVQRTATIIIEPQTSQDLSHYSRYPTTFTPCINDPQSSEIITSDVATPISTREEGHSTVGKSTEENSTEAHAIVNIPIHYTTTTRGNPPIGGNVSVLAVTIETRREDLEPDTTTADRRNSTTIAVRGQGYNDVIPVLVCPCACANRTVSYNMIPDKLIVQLTSRIETTLTIDASNISSVVRRKTSAHDPRVSSHVAGGLGVCVIVLSLGMVVAMDADRIFKCIHK